MWAASPSCGTTSTCPISGRRCRMTWCSTSSRASVSRARSSDEVFPTGDELRAALAQRSMRLAEWYVSLPVTDVGLASDAESVAGDALERLVAAGGEVLCVAVDGSVERDSVSGRVEDGAPQWPEAAFAELAGLLDRLVEEAPGDERVAFHPHVASWVEAPGEVDALTEALAESGGGAGLCLDVGHYTVGGGDPVDAIRRHGPLIRHVHAKDVDPAVLARVRAGEVSGMWRMIRERIFTGLGNGVLDLPGVVAALDDIGYDGWIMVEQDSSWLPPRRHRPLGCARFARPWRKSEPDAGRRHRRREHGGHACLAAGRPARGHRDPARRAGCGTRHRCGGRGRGARRCLRRGVRNRRGGRHRQSIIGPRRERRGRGRRGGPGAVREAADRGSGQPPRPSSSLVERAGAHVEMGFQRRHDVAFAEARRRVADGSTGRIELLRLTAFDPRGAERAADEWPVTEAAPMLLHSSVHDFDFARWMTGSEVEEVTAIGSHRDGRPATDPRGIETVVVTMRMAGGALVSLDATWLHPGGYDIRAELIAEREHLTVGLSGRTPAEHLSWTDAPRGDRWTGYLERFTDAYRAESSLSWPPRAARWRRHRACATATRPCGSRWPRPAPTSSAARLRWPRCTARCEPSGSRCAHAESHDPRPPGPAPPGATRRALHRRAPRGHAIAGPW